MAGRQRRKEMIQILERRLRDWEQTQDDGVYTVVDYVVSWVASGCTLLKLADEITKEMNWDISRDMVTRYINSLDPNAPRRLERARLDGAHGLVDQAVKTIDDASTADKEQLMKAKMQADVRQWTAERWNRKELGRAPDVQITVNNNTLHLDALRRRALATTELVKELPESQASHARLISADRAVSEADDIADVISVEPPES